MAVTAILLLLALCWKAWDLLRAPSASSQLDTISSDEGFRFRPPETRVVRETRRNHCGNRAFDDYPPFVSRTYAAGADVGGVVRQLRSAFEDAGWRLVRGRPTDAGHQPISFEKEFDESVAEARVTSSGQGLVDVYVGVVSPSFC